MQNELEQEAPGAVQLLGVNERGMESGNSGLTDVSLPLLQDTVEVDAWARWLVSYRDVVVLDGQGRRRGVYNLTAHDLHQESARAELKMLLLNAR